MFTGPMEYKEVVSQLRRTSYFWNRCLFRLMIHAMTLATPNVGLDIPFESTPLVYPTTKQRAIATSGRGPEKVHSTVIVTRVTYGEKTARP